ncbi:MAG TPA: peptidylprolyl isomerase [Anaerolineaceae bacterium]|nr:peptidylprolyl isomerase [Anaerolineaceae bacterium]
MENPNKPQSIQDDVVVKLSYVLTVDNEVVDSAEKEEPIEFIQGHGHIIPGLERELYGMNIGDEKSVTVQPEEGYGEFDETAIISVPRSEFPEGVPLEPGIPLQVRTEEGELLDSRIHSVGDDAIQLDFNHPLAGKSLNFNVIVVDLRSATSEELEHGHTHTDGHNHE